jgi:(1->4)-alpha-D-glucan 1-alpha-D-glucosylmutase
MLKSAREAKTNTTWINPNAEYEEALMKFSDSVLSSKQFLDAFLPFKQRISNLGMFNSLSQTLLKVTSPGVPDFYQGTEIWNLVLVDPDNRRPVDYDIRKRLFDEIRELEDSRGKLDLSRELTSTREDGRIKLYLTYRALNLRREKRDLFMQGRYSPLSAIGEGERHIIAFERSDAESSIIVVVPRLLAGMIGPSETPTGGIWKDTRLVVPSREKAGRFKDIFTGKTFKLETVRKGEVSIMLSELLSDFPVALLEELKAS